MKLAQVTMGSPGAAAGALAAVVTAGGAVLNVTPFSKDQAAASTVRAAWGAVAVASHPLGDWVYVSALFPGHGGC